jgi:signal transduction histidine kinase
MFDADLRLVTFNRTFARMRPPHAAGIAVGDTLRQLLERTAVDGRHPATGEAADTWIARTESRHRGPGGTFDERLANQVVRVSVSRTRDGGSVALLTDITELALIQRSLEAARDAEQHANHAKSAFLASMSHELRTPLNSIIGFTKQVRKNKGGHLLPTDVTYLERVERNAIQLLALINSLLDLSRIESGKQEVDLAPTELATLLRETVAQLEGQARPGVALRVEAPDEAPLLEIDGAKLRQVVINLVGNALKFTHNGSVTVRLRLGETGEPTAIEVEDTGIGIPHDRLEAIFQAFEQAERTTARDYGGTGLGLNISRSLCALIGARLEVTSVVGVGTTFRIGLGESPSERPAMPALAEPALTGL